MVIPCYGCEATIERAVDSVLSQTLLPSEIILVDDRSRDGSLQTMTRLQERLTAVPIKIIAEQQNRGPGSARNRGWEQAANPYIAFLDSDDAWEPEKIALQYDMMCEDETIGLSGHLLVWDKTDGIEAPQERRSEVGRKDITAWQVLLSNQFKTTSTVMVRRDITTRFQEEKRYAEDFQLLCEALLDGYKAFRIELPLVRQFKAPFGSGGLSGNIWSIVNGERETYVLLHKTSRISLSTMLFLIVYLYAKALRRVLVVSSRRPSKHRPDEQEVR